MHYAPIDPIAFKIPFFELEIYWYGILFAIGLGLSLLIYQYLLKCDGLKPYNIQKHTDRFLPLLIIFVLIGARLAEALAYSPSLITNIKSFFAFRDGGLASHGGIIGALLAPKAYLLMNKEQFRLSYWEMIDRLTLSCAPLAVCIRIANFINQELLGTETTQPWGIIYTDHNTLVPLARHPVVLYEAIGYALIALIFWKLRKTLWEKCRAGTLSLLWLTNAMVLRILCEQFKLEVSLWEPSFLKMGQVLSLCLMIAYPSIWILTSKNKKNSL